MTVERPSLPGIEATAVVLRATGKVDATGKPYANTHARVAVGHRVVEIALRNLALPEQELLALLADVAQRVRTTPSTTQPATAPR